MAWSVNAFSNPNVTISTTAPNRGIPLAWRQMARRFTTNATTTSANLVNHQNSGSGALDDLQVFKVPEGYELGLKFRSAAAGHVTAFRVFRPIGGPAAYTLRLGDGGENVLDQVSASGLSATGWIEVPLAAPRAITANTNYVASYGVAEGGFYQATPNGLQTSIVNDAEGDLFNNLLEYALERSPTLAEPPPPGLTATGLPLNLTFKRARADVDLHRPDQPRPRYLDRPHNQPRQRRRTVTVSSTNASDHFIRLRV